MPDRPDPRSVDFGPRLQQIDPPHVVDDPLHRSRDVLVVLEIVVFVIAKRRIIGRQHHVASLGHFLRISPVGARAGVVDDPLSSRAGGMQCQNSRPSFVMGTACRKIQIGRHAIVFVDGVRERQPCVALSRERRFLVNANIQRRLLRQIGKRPHRLFHAGKYLFAPLEPVCGRRHRMFFILGVAKGQQVGVIDRHRRIFGHAGERRGISPPVGPNESTCGQRNRNQTHNCNSDVHRVIVLHI